MPRSATDLEVRPPLAEIRRAFRGIRVSLDERRTIGAGSLDSVVWEGSEPDLHYCVVRADRFRCPCECARVRGDLRLALELCGGKFWCVSVLL